MSAPVPPGHAWPSAGGRGAAAGSGGHGIRARAEHAKISGDDFVAGAFLSFFIGPLAGLDAAFQIDLRTLFQILLSDLRLFGPDDNFVPFSALLALTVFIFERFIGGHREITDGLAGAGVSSFR